MVGIIIIVVDYYNIRDVGKGRVIYIFWISNDNSSGGSSSSSSSKNNSSKNNTSGDDGDSDEDGDGDNFIYKDASISQIEY